MANILVICAHPDDHIFGPGGTIAKYAEEGHNIYTYIFSYGEKSHPWFQRKVAVKMRVKEAQRADKLIGGKGVIFLGITEGKFEKEFKDKKMKQKLASIIKKHNPEKIFTHSVDDPLPDHRAVNKLVIETVNGKNIDTEIYTFDVWNIFNLKKMETPKLVVDISQTFKKKIAALKCFKSQFSLHTVGNYIPYIGVYFRAFMNGLMNNTKFAEVFYKVK